MKKLISFVIIATFCIGMVALVNGKPLDNILGVDAIFYSFSTHDWHVDDVRSIYTELVIPSYEEMIENWSQLRTAPSEEDVSTIGGRFTTLGERIMLLIRGCWVSIKGGYLFANAMFAEAIQLVSFFISFFTMVFEWIF